MTWAEFRSHSRALLATRPLPDGKVSKDVSRPELDESLTKNLEGLVERAAALEKRGAGLADLLEKLADDSLDKIDVVVGVEALREMGATARMLADQFSVIG